MHMGERWRLGHRPGLDGLRGIAIGLVLACHLFAHRWPNAIGSAGVTAFFTLSGFLITALLLESAGNGPLSLKRFYVRRARRLLPALAVVLTAFAPLLMVAGLLSGRTLLWVVLYAANWASTAGLDLRPVEHLWSLAVEEQFYLAWPLVLLAVRRWRHGPMVVAVVGIVVSLGTRFALWDGGAGVFRVTSGTDTRADALFVGCALAIALASGVRLRAPGWLVAIAVVAAAVAIAAVPATVGTALVAPTVVPWVTALGLLYALTSPRILIGASLRWLGTRSYGIYLWHWPPMYLTALLTGGNQLAITLALLASLGIAELSYRFVEQPFLRGRSVVATSAPRARLVALGRRPDASRPDAELVFARI